MLRFVLLLVLILGATLPAPQALAQSQNPGRMVFEFEGSTAVTGDPARRSTAGARVLVDFKGILTMGTLLGSPVIMVRMKYDVVGGSVTVPTFEPGESAYETIDLDQIPDVARSKVDLYGFKLAFHFSTYGAENAMIIEDGGALMRAGDYSYNVPGASSWDQVFVTSLGDWTDRGIEYMGAERAFETWKGGLSLFDVEVHDVKMTMNDLHHWWAENNDRPRYLATERAIKRLSEGLSLSYGFCVGPDQIPVKEARDIFINAEAKRGTGRVATGIDSTSQLVSELENYLLLYGQAADRLDTVLARMQSLPAKFRKGDNHAPFAQALEDSRAITSQVASWRATYQSDDIDPAGLPVGRPQKMDALELTLDGSYVLADGARLHGPWENPQLLESRYLITGKCKSRVLRDAQTAQVIRQLPGTWASFSTGENGKVIKTSSFHSFKANKCSVGLNLVPCGEKAAIVFDEAVWDLSGTLLTMGRYSQWNNGRLKSQAAVEAC